MVQFAPESLDIPGRQRQTVPLPAVRHVERAVAVGDQREAIRPFHLLRQQQPFALQVLAVGDDFGGQFVEIERGFHQAAAHGVGLRLPQPGAVGHGTKQVIDAAHAPADGRLDLLERGVRMTRVAAGADGLAYDFHALRHQFITDMVNAGVHPKDAQAPARHSTITLTMDRYAHVRPANLHAALDRLAPLAAPPAEAAPPKSAGRNRRA